MNEWEAKQAARKQRYADRAESLREEASRTFNEARNMARVIPFGQPILVGHHSEGKDRRYRARIDRKFEKAFALQKRADHYEGRANTESDAISSDDEDALTKLRAKLAKLEDKQASMKAANKLVRKGTKEALEELAEMVGKAAADQLMKPDFCGRIGFPNYMLTNNNANMRRIRMRIEQLERAKAAPPVEDITGDGFTIREDRDDNRVLVIFDAKPPKETCRLLRSHGFKWSPSRVAWVRMLNGNGRYAASRVLKTLNKDGNE